MERFQVLIISFLLLFSFGLVSAGVETEPDFVFAIDEVFTLDIKMTNYDLSECPGCSCKLSIFYPNGSALIRNAPGTVTDSYCIYQNNASLLGSYGYDMYFTNGIDYGQVTGDFLVTPNGEIVTIAKTIIYLGLAATLLIILIFLLFITFSTENFGWRIGLSAFSYVISNVFLLVCWKIAEMFLTSVPFIETIFRILYISSNVIYLPFFLGIVVVYLLHMTNEKNIETLMNRGFSEDQARWRAGKK